MRRQSFILEKYFNKTIQKKLNSLARDKKVAFVMCSELSMMQYAKNGVFDTPLYFDEHNVEYKLIQRAIKCVKGIRKYILEREMKEIRKFESWAVNHADKVFTTSELDKCDLQNISGVDSRKIRVVNNSYPDKGLGNTLSLSQSPTIVFVGNLGWLPNKHGILHFVRNVLPRLSRKIPNLVFNIIGSNIPKELRAYARDNPMRIYSDASEIQKDEIIHESWLSVVPLYFASGSRIKIIEFWSHGKTVISTKIGAEGLVESIGTEIVSSDDEFVRTIEAMLKDKNKLADMGRSNYKMYKKEYAPKRVYEDSLYNTIATE